jgi:hypothetical protein
MGSGQSITGAGSGSKALPLRLPSTHIYELEEDIKWKEQIQSGADLHDTLPEDATGEDVVWRLRKSNREPWKEVQPPKEDGFNADLYDTDNGTNDSLSTSTSIIHQKHLQIMQYMTHWCERNKGWSLILEEKGQPIRPITGGFAGAMKNTRFDKWNRHDAKPLIARCPGGTSNPVNIFMCTKQLTCVHCLSLSVCLSSSFFYYCFFFFFFFFFLKYGMLVLFLSY